MGCLQIRQNKGENENQNCKILTYVVNTMK